MPFLILSRGIRVFTGLLTQAEDEGFVEELDEELQEGLKAVVSRLVEKYPDRGLDFQEWQP